MQRSLLQGPHASLQQQLEPAPGLANLHTMDFADETWLLFHHSKVLQLND